MIRDLRQSGLLAGLLVLVLLLQFVNYGHSSNLTGSDPDRAALHQVLLDLTNPWTVMCVAAHPDDEDGSTLTILRRKFGFNTVTLFATYGEGGQNVVGQEVGEPLGVIRAHETLAASEIQGSEPHFLGLSDFGYSKSAEETFRFWGRNEALRRLVLKIRQLRPDVIITNHGPMGGHGHHQAVGRLLEEAFEAAADPKRFAEQLQQFEVWQPKRLFVRFGFRSDPTLSSSNAANVITIDPNEMDPVRGKTFAEQALSALQLHATQGPWPKTLPPTGGRIIRYRLARHAEGTEDLPEKAQLFTDGLSVPEPSMPRFTESEESLNDRDKLLANLSAYRRALTEDVERSSAHKHRLMMKRLNDAFAVAAGIRLDVSSATRVLVPDIPTQFLIKMSSQSPVNLRRLNFYSWSERRQINVDDKSISRNPVSITLESTTPKQVEITIPRWEHLYDGRFFGHTFAAMADLEIDGVPFSVQAETKLQAAPAVTIERVSPSPYVTVPATVDRPVSLEVTLTNNLSTPFRGTLSLSNGELKTTEVASEISLEPHQTRTFEISSNSKPASKIRRPEANHPSDLMVVALQQHNPQTLLTSKTIRTIHNDALVRKGLKVGYLPSFDDTLEVSLKALDVQATALSVDIIRTADLSLYDTVIIDNRGYEAHPDLIAGNSRLLDYVKGGGTLIIFYHKTNEWNPDERRGRPQLAPYPLILGSARVTEEDSKVSFLEPTHRMLNSPNRITEKDFENWVQERGLYYPREWDQQYQTILATSDQSEEPLKGGILVARYGKGTYIYTSMVWYRQLRAGVPGAYRFFANMISVN